MEATVRSKREVEIAAPPDVVWEVLTGFEQWPQWNPEVKSMSIDGPVAPGTEFRWKAGPGTIVPTLEQVDPPGSSAGEGGRCRSRRSTSGGSSLRAAGRG